MSWFTVSYNQVMEWPTYTWRLLNSLCLGAWDWLCYYLSHTGEWLVCSLNRGTQWISSSLNAATSWLGDASAKVIDLARFCFDHTVKWLTIISTGLTDGVVYFSNSVRDLIISFVQARWWWYICVFLLLFLLLFIILLQLNKRRDTLKSRLLSWYRCVVALFMLNWNILKTRSKLCGCLFCEAWSKFRVMIGTGFARIWRRSKSFAMVMKCWLVWAKFLWQLYSNVGVKGEG